MLSSAFLWVSLTFAAWWHCHMPGGLGCFPSWVDSGKWSCKKSVKRPKGPFQARWMDNKMAEGILCQDKQPTLSGDSATTGLNTYGSEPAVLADLEPLEVREVVPLGLIKAYKGHFEFCWKCHFFLFWGLQRLQAEAEMKGHSSPHFQWF